MLKEKRDTDELFNSKAYKISRQSYIWQCTFEYFVSLLVTDAFLAKLLSNMGISDSVTGIISSLVSFAFLFQLFTIFIVQKITNVKRISVFFDSLSTLLFMSLYLLPFLSLSKEVKTFLVIAAVVLAYFSKYLVASIIFKWANSYVDPGKRGSYSAIKEMVSLATGMIFTFAVGQIIDRYEALNNLEGGFIFIAAAILILSICNFITLMLIKDKKEEKTVQTPMREVLENTLGNKNFRSVIIMSVIQYIGVYMVVGFLGTYKTKDLLMTVGAVQIINIAANAFRFAFSMPIGKYSNKRGFTKGAELGFSIMALAFLSLIFCNLNRWWLIIVYTILYNVGVAGTNANMMNIVYSYVKSEYFVQASAIKNSISGIVGFLTSLVAGKILSAIQQRGNLIFSMRINGQQVLALISFLLMTGLVLYTHFVVAKQKKMIQ